MSKKKKPKIETKEPFITQMDDLFNKLNIGFDKVGDQLVMLQGYLVDGPPTPILSGKPGMFKLGGPKTYLIYLDLTSAEYIEVDVDMVVDFRPVNTNLYPMSGMFIWIKASAPVRYVTSASMQEVADFLSGEVVDQDIPETTGLPNALARRLRKRRRGVNGSFGGCNSNAVAPVCPN